MAHLHLFEHMRPFLHPEFGGRAERQGADLRLGGEAEQIQENVAEPAVEFRLREVPRVAALAVVPSPQHVSWNQIVGLRRTHIHRAALRSRRSTDRP